MAQSGSMTLKQDHPLRITALKEWSFKKICLTFLGIYGGIWAFLDPLFTLFGKEGPIASLGFWRYCLLVIISLSATITIHYFDRKRLIGRLSFIRFEMILTETGMRIPVEAPQDMNIQVFIEEFFFKMRYSEIGTPNTYFADLYDNELLVKRSREQIDDNTYIRREVDHELHIKREDNFEIVSGDKTLREAGIRDGDECKIVGTIKESKVHVQYSRLPPRYQ